MSLAASMGRGMLLVVLAIGCVHLAVSKSKAQPQGTPNPQHRSSAAAQPHNLGQRTFESRCAGCHGLDGRGTERAPDITTRQNVERQTDGALRRTIQYGISGTGMPAFSMLKDAEAQSVVNYLRVLQGKREVSGTAETSRRGQSLFFGKARCAECHTVRGKGGFIASELSEFGRTHSAAEIRRVITFPGEVGKRGELMVVKARNGRDLSGLVRNEDNFSLQLQTLDGGFQLLLKSDIENLRQAGPLMPSDYAAKLTPTEIDELVDFLMRVSGPPLKRAKEEDFEE